MEFRIRHTTQYLWYCQLLSIVVRQNSIVERFKTFTINIHNLNLLETFLPSNLFTIKVNILLLKIKNVHFQQQNRPKLHLYFPRLGILFKVCEIVFIVLKMRRLVTSFIAFSLVGAMESEMESALLEEGCILNILFLNKFL